MTPTLPLAPPAERCTVSTAARLLDCSRSKIFELIAQGWLCRWLMRFPDSQRETAYLDLAEVRYLVRADHDGLCELKARLGRPLPLSRQ